jgi:hypothetical protein
VVAVAQQDIGELCLHSMGQVWVALEPFGREAPGEIPVACGAWNAYNPKMCSTRRASEGSMRIRTGRGLGDLPPDVPSTVLVGVLNEHLGDRIAD